jgi:hypothetical protein
MSTFVAGPETAADSVAPEVSTNIPTEVSIELLAEGLHDAAITTEHTETEITPKSADESSAELSTSEQASPAPLKIPPTLKKRDRSESSTSNIVFAFGSAQALERHRVLSNWWKRHNKIFQYWFLGWF